MKMLPKLFAAAAAAAAMAAITIGAAPQVRAETPPDTLIQAWSIDDMISLDPAEVFEFTASEILGNSYQTLIGYDVENVSDIFGVVAESWEVSEDGKTITFKVREGNRFASGNPLTAADAVYSLQRAVKLDKSPAFILTQFGFNADNVDAMIRQTGEYTFEFEMDAAYAPTLVLYCLTATVAMVVDSELVRSNEVDGDFGYDWLKVNYAGSGPFTIREWRANEVVVLERNDDFVGDAPPMARAIYRHIPEGSTQRLLLEQGDIDIARDLGAEEITGLADNPDIVIDSGVKGAVYYLGSEPEERVSRQARSAAGDEVSGRLRGHRRHDHEGSGDRPPGVPADRVPRRSGGHALLAGRREGQGASGRGGSARRVHGDDGHPQHARHHRHGAGDPADLRRRPGSRWSSSRVTASRR